MRHILSGLLSVVMLAVCCGCSKDEDASLIPPGYDGDILYPYLLNLRIIDGQGKDLLEDVYAGSEPIKWSDTDSARIVSTSVMTTAESIGSEQYENGLRYISNDKNGSKALLMYQYIGVSFNPHSSYYNLQIKSPDIFGDSKVHVIKSNWKHKGYTNMCKEVTFDGVRCSLEVAKEVKSEWLNNVTVYYYDVVIVVDGK